MARQSPFWEPNKSLREAELAAEGALGYCAEQLGLSELPLPIPVETWIEHPLGLRLSIDNLSFGGVQAQGGVNIGENEILIDESLSDDDPQFRFTCAHELGHFVLHYEAKRLFEKTTHTGEVFLDIYEQQADRFAEAFLIPPAVLLHELNELGLKSEGAEHLIEGLIRGTREASDLLVTNLDILVVRLAVPTHALMARLASLTFRDGGRLLAAPVREELRRFVPEVTAD